MNINLDSHNAWIDRIRLDSLTNGSRDKLNLPQIDSTGGPFCTTFAAINVAQILVALIRWDEFRTSERRRGQGLQSRAERRTFLLAPFSPHKPSATLHESWKSCYRLEP